MLRTVYEGKDVAVKFYHKTLVADELKDEWGVYVDGPRRCTMAIISLGGREVGSGLSICNPIDNFRRSTGRKRSLVNCLSAFSHELRSKVWEEYGAQFGF